MIAIGKHMLATEDGNSWLVTTGKGAILGVIEWHTKWRQYEFAPAAMTAYTHDCMTAMGAFLSEQTAKRRKGSAQ